MSFTSADLPMMRNRVFKWATAYYEAAAETVNKYQNAQNVFPESLQEHARRVHLIVAPEMLLASVYADDGPWTAEWSDTTPLFSIQPFQNLIERRRARGKSYRIDAFITRKGRNEHDTEWERLVASNFSTTKYWTPEDARAEARSVVLAQTIDRLLGKHSDRRSATAAERSEDPRSHVARELRRLINDFETVLADASREEEVQRFIKKSPHLLDLRAISVDPKVPLGTEYVTDFVVELPGGRYLLVELERASHALYTKAYNQTAALTHAVRQVEDWMEWSYNNLSYLRTRYPDIHEPEGLVVLGRRSTLDYKATKALRRRNVLSKVRVITYDDLIDDVKAIAANLERGTIPQSSVVTL